MFVINDLNDTLINKTAAALLIDCSVNPLIISALMDITHMRYTNKVSIFSPS